AGFIAVSAGSTKPFASNATPDPDNQPVFGSAPMNKKRCQVLAAHKQQHFGDVAREINGYLSGGKRASGRSRARCEHRIDLACCAGLKLPNLQPHVTSSRSHVSKGGLCSQSEISASAKIQIGTQRPPAQKAVCSACICLLPVKAHIQNFQNLNRKHPFHRFCLHFTS